MTAGTSRLEACSYHAWPEDGAVVDTKEDM